VVKLLRLIRNQVGISINPPTQPDWIRLDVAPQHRIIIPVIVIIQPGFLVKILPWKAQVVSEFTIFVIIITFNAFTVDGVFFMFLAFVYGCDCVAKRLTLPVPDFFSLAVCDNSGTVEVVAKI